MQRVRALDVLLHDVLVELARREVAAVRGDDPAVLDCIRVVLAQGQQLMVELELRAGQRRRHRDRLESDLAGPFERVDQRRELAARGSAVEAADADVDRMDLAAAHDRHHLVARLFQRQPVRDELGVVAGHRRRALVAEEVGCVQEEDVQRMALDPLAAVEQPPQRADALVDGDAERVLHRVAGAHLVRDRADAADAGGDVGRLQVGAPAQEGLEEPRRLVDSQLDLLHCAVADDDAHRPLSLDAREEVGRDRAAPVPARPRHASRSARGRARRRR
jgi:hypothetical protein